jgi:cellulose synthase/poly-beta-1,6-N-acetylglucosamine synthase-like glycosyltransferase
MTVSIVTPTTHDRKEFNDRCVSMARNQTYGAIVEHLFDYSTDNIGTKRERLFRSAIGDIIINFDSDDIYLPQYVELAVNAITQSKYGLLGLHNFYMHHVANNTFHLFNNVGYIAEATFVYMRDGFCGFPNKHTNEGWHVMQNMKFASYHNPYFLATVHGANTCGHKTIPLIKKLPQNEAASLFCTFYSTTLDQ